MGLGSDVEVAHECNRVAVLLWCGSGIFDEDADKGWGRNDPCSHRIKLIQISRQC